MKSLPRWAFGFLSLLVSATASASSATTYEGIWADDWLGGYGAWLPLGLVVTAYAVVWLARKQKK